MKSDKARSLIEKYAVGSSRDAAPSLLKRTAILCVEVAEQKNRGKGARKGAQNHSRHDDGHAPRRYVSKDSRRIYPKTERRW